MNVNHSLVTALHRYPVKIQIVARSILRSAQRTCEFCRIPDPTVVVGGQKQTRRHDTGPRTRFSG